MTTPKRLLLLAISLCATAASGQQIRRSANIGYLYPAGGQRGTTVEVLVGGQFLGAAKEVLITGDGVRGTVVKHYRGFRNLNGDQRRLLQQQLKDLRAQRTAELTGQPAPAPAMAEEKKDPDAPTVRLPEHPLLRDLEQKSLKQLIEVGQEFFNVYKRQPNAQIGESVLVEVVLDPDAEPGDRELRLRAPNGVTNPMCFQVGMLPETREQEPNGPLDYVVMPNLPKEPPLELPVLVNGQVKPGDVDRIPFRAEKGQRLVIDAKARHLVPFLADAVPGWFQATVAVYDANGNEVAFEDDYRFEPDPVLLFEVPETGVYELEIHDAIYRGREDFVYRVSLSERPFITAMFPLGGPAGVATTATIAGWNLPTQRLQLDTSPGPVAVRRTALTVDGPLSNTVFYAVGTLPERAEKEPNNTPQDAEAIDLGLIVNGRIEKPGDVDVFQFSGKADEEVVAEVNARRLHSPLDSLVRLTDAAGKVLAWNDDSMDMDGYLHRDMGLLTHHADSRLVAKLPNDGSYFAHIADAQNHGGEAYAYRLRLSPPRPEFELRVAPSSFTLRAGMAAPLYVYALRKDGFEGEIDLSLVDAPAGFKLDGARIPRGRDRVCMTLAAPGKGLPEPIDLHIEGRATLGGATVARRVVPCENTMQAFLWRHLAPTQELLVSVNGGRISWPTMHVLGQSPLKIPTTGTATVSLKTAHLPIMQRLDLQFKEPAEGLALKEAVATPGGLKLELKVMGDTLKPGYADNLVVEAFAEVGWGKRPKRRTSLGVLPAIPFEVVEG